MQAWLFLAAAIALEVAGTTSMKLSDGLSKLLPTTLVCVCYAGAFASMSFALRKLDVSVVYAIWSGVGTAAIALIGAACFRENMNLVKLVSLALIIVGVVGLNLAGSRH